MKQLSFLLLCTVMSAAAMENTNNAQLADGAKNTSATQSTSSAIIDYKEQHEENRATLQKDKLSFVELIYLALAIDYKEQHEENRATLQKDKLSFVELIHLALAFVNKHADILPYHSIREITYLCGLISQAAIDNKLIYITKRNVEEKTLEFIYLDNSLRNKKNTEYVHIEKKYWNKDEENVSFYVITMDDLAQDKENGPFHLIRKNYLDEENVLFFENVLFSEDESDTYLNNVEQNEENVSFLEGESDSSSKKRKHQNLNNASDDSDTSSKKRSRLDTNIKTSQLPPLSPENGQWDKLRYLSKDQLCDEFPKLQNTKTDEIKEIDIINELCNRIIKLQNTKTDEDEKFGSTQNLNNAQSGLSADKLREIYDIIKLLRENPEKLIEKEFDSRKYGFERLKTK